MTSLSTATPLVHWHPPALPEQFVTEHWYAAYTCSNQEKQVAAQLAVRNIEYFLPLYTSPRRWKDRRVNLELPLFPGYVFVRLALKDRLRLLQIPNVVRLVGFGGLPTPLPNAEMEIMRSGLPQNLQAKPHPFLTIGRRVRIRCGPLAGLEGILLRKKGKLRFVLSLDLIQRSLVSDVEVTDIEAIN